MRIIADYPPLRHIADAALWNQLDEWLKRFRRDAVSLELESGEVRVMTKGMRRASQLARHAVSNHAFYRPNYGRAGERQVCHPVCLVPSCRGPRFASMEEYETRMDDRHPIKVVSPQGGRFCSGAVGEEPYVQ